MIYQNSDVSKNEWNKLLSTNKYASPFQSQAYYDLINSVKGYSAEVIAIGNNGTYLALMVVSIYKETGLKCYFSRRGLVYGGPLIAEGVEGKHALKILLEKVQAVLNKRVIYCEVRNGFDYSEYKEEFEEYGWSYESHLNVQLNLVNTSIEAAIAKMKYNRRREIQMTIKEGTSEREAKNIEEVKAVYEILHHLYKKKVKVPLPEYQFFEKLFNSPIGKAFVVFHNHKIIGGSFCFFFPSKTLYTLYYTGLRDYHKKIFPTHMAIIEAMRFCIENNIEVLDFMGAGKPGQPYGVRVYKLEFGGQLVEHGRYKKIYNHVLFNIGKVGLKILAKSQS